MFGFLKKDGNIVSPVQGKCIKIEEVPDQVFSSKMMGDGFAIVPTGEVVVSPVTGEIVLIPNSKHAVGLKTKDSIEVLVHIGLDTVNLGGDGFTALVKQGDKVKAGAPLIKFDKKYISEKGINLTTMVIFTGGYAKEINLDCYDQEVDAGEILIR